MRTMTTMLFVIALMSGCGSNVGGASAGAGRTVPNTRAEAFRECREFGFDDDLIDTMFVILETDREAGLTEVDALAINLNRCSDFVDFTGCLNCATAVVDAVYP